MDFLTFLYRKQKVALKSDQLSKPIFISWTFCFQKFVDNAQQCFTFTPQTNFPAHNLNFHLRWLGSRLPFKIFSTLRNQRTDFLTFPYRKRKVALKSDQLSKPIFISWTSAKNGSALRLISLRVKGTFF
jgi:hypothetical protein